MWTALLHLALSLVCNLPLPRFGGQAGAARRFSDADISEMGGKHTIRYTLLPFWLPLDQRLPDQQHDVCDRGNVRPMVLLLQL